MLNCGAVLAIARVMIVFISRRGARSVKKGNRDGSGDGAAAKEHSFACSLHCLTLIS
ncbi:hypothetical protein [Caballeronia sp. PC1]|uniref:hypothetical protein n=1 Tax=Caballeronia sp. PC1 TaxID=2906765 RepID=UPI001F43E983|nr:hypothetical protein [Caballeronia sp. PC1]MCE4544874.1 hypothetical protein [Caballeronia sp. PC1]